MPLTVWTVGHSTRSESEFIAVLSACRIELVVDVRRFPGSRRLPQFDSAPLERALATKGIAYRWIELLGGRRRGNPRSLNTGWTHPAFRAYADYVATEEFADGLFELLILAGAVRTAIMCAEVLWWRCHRRIVADVLTSLGVRVIHIRDARHAGLHRLVAPAHLVGGRLSYIMAD
jgi:uncharacterized protein (DUF488 family)